MKKKFKSVIIGLVLALVIGISLSAFGGNKLYGDKVAGDPPYRVLLGDPPY